MKTTILQEYSLDPPVSVLALFFISRYEEEKHLHKRLNTLVYLCQILCSYGIWCGIRYQKDSPGSQHQHLFDILYCSVLIMRIRNFIGLQLGNRSPIPVYNRIIHPTFQQILFSLICKRTERTTFAKGEGSSEDQRDIGGISRDKTNRDILFLVFNLLPARWRIERKPVHAIGI